jgi:hypothetical protein
LGLSFWLRILVLCLRLGVLDDLGLGSWVMSFGFGFWVCFSGFQTLCFVFGIVGSGVWVLDVGCWVLGVGCSVWCLGF